MIEIILIIVGVIFIIVSFFVQEKLTGKDVQTIADMSEKELNVIVEKELKDANSKIEDAITETFDDSMEIAKRGLEKVTNEKIILRHLLATAFGMFFRQNSYFFENIDTLVCGGGIEKFKEYLETRPEKLKEFIDNKVLDEQTYDLYSDFKWLDVLKKNGDYLDNFEKSITDLISQFETAKEDAKAEDNLAQANYYRIWHIVFHLSSVRVGYKYYLGLCSLYLLFLKLVQRLIHILFDF